MIKVEEVNKLKEGRFIIIENEAYKINSITKSKAGKHGSAKARIEAVSVIGNKKRSIVKGTGDKVETPIIDKRSAQVLTLRTEVLTRGIEQIEKRIANVMDMESFETFDIEVPEEFNELKEGNEVMYWNILGNKVIQQIKKAA